MSDVALLAHLIDPLEKGGHGFETGIPITDVANAETFHADDHWPGGWWAEALTHAYGQEASDG